VTAFDPWCVICQDRHPRVNLSANWDVGGWAGLLAELRSFIRAAPVTRRRSAMRTDYRRRNRTRTRTRSRR
jgi:hypothetical protein